MHCVVFALHTGERLAGRTGHLLHNWPQLVLAHSVGVVTVVVAVVAIAVVYLRMFYNRCFDNYCWSRLHYDSCYYKVDICLVHRQFAEMCRVVLLYGNG